MDVYVLVVAFIFTLLMRINVLLLGEKSLYRREMHFLKMRRQNMNHRLTQIIAYVMAVYCISFKFTKVCTLIIIQCDELLLLLHSFRLFIRYRTLLLNLIIYFMVNGLLPSIQKILFKKKFIAQYFRMERIIAIFR